ncbi:enoyl-CoA hydratase/isomerase family protein [Burkholderia stagnalis]|uniref:enoyl-CoA hydratase/isomerase family protein n=1 Tax=Burkholderia stagnalis TaxID=1503054 RepID=UPI0022AA40D1|nr:enoyl-CoA hydratase-related protein [Burkholderia stagnalis]
MSCSTSTPPPASPPSRSTGPALNTLDRALSDGLRDALAPVEFDDAVRAVVLQGARSHFMAGGDLKIFHAMLDRAPDDRRQQFEHFIADVHEAIIRIRRVGKPVIASVRGAVAGFGLSLMNSCDLAVATDDAYFTMAYCNIGASPDGSGTYGLPRVVGLKRAMEIALLGDRFDAAQALDWGLANRVVPAAELDATTRALGRTRQLLNASLTRTLSEQLLAEQESFSACTTDAYFEHGARAFVEKRKPRFEGR